MIHKFVWKMVCELGIFIVWEYLFRKFTNYLPYKFVDHPPTIWKCVMEPLNILQSESVSWNHLIFYAVYYPEEVAKFELLQFLTGGVSPQNMLSN